MIALFDFLLMAFCFFSLKIYEMVKNHSTDLYEK